MSSQFRVFCLDRCFFERADEMVAQVQSISKVLERQSVLGQSSKTAKVCYVPKPQNQMIIRDYVSVRAKTGACCDGLLIEIDRLDIAHVHVCVWEPTANWADSVSNAYAAGDDFGQHWLEHKIVFSIDEYDFKIVTGPKRPLEVLCS